MFIGTITEINKHGTVIFSKNGSEFITDNNYTKEYLCIFGIKILYRTHQFKSELTFPQDNNKVNVGFKKHTDV